MGQLEAYGVNEMYLSGLMTGLFANYIAEEHESDTFESFKSYFYSANLALLATKKWTISSVVQRLLWNTYVVTTYFCLFIMVVYAIYLLIYLIILYVGVNPEWAQYINRIVPGILVLFNVACMYSSCALTNGQMLYSRSFETTRLLALITLLYLTGLFVWLLPCLLAVWLVLPAFIRQFIEVKINTCLVMVRARLTPKLALIVVLLIAASLYLVFNISLGNTQVVSGGLGSTVKVPGPSLSATRASFKLFDLRGLAGTWYENKIKSGMTPEARWHSQQLSQQARGARSAHSSGFLADTALSAAGYKPIPVVPQVYIDDYNMKWGKDIPMDTPKQGVHPVLAHAIKVASMPSAIVAERRMAINYLAFADNRPVQPSNSVEYVEHRLRSKVVSVKDFIGIK